MFFKAPPPFLSVHYAPGVTSRSVSKHSWHLNFSQILGGVSLGQRGGVQSATPRYAFRETLVEICFPRRGAQWLPDVRSAFPQIQGRADVHCYLPTLPFCLVDAEAEEVVVVGGKLNDMCKGTTHGSCCFLSGPRGASPVRCTPRRDRPCSPPLACPEVASVPAGTPLGR